MSSDFTPLAETHHVRRRLAFDPTVNLGHVLTFVGALVAGVSAYSTLDKRISVIESQTSVVTERTRDQDSRMKETLSDIKSDVKDLQRSLNDFSRNLGGTPTRGSTP